MQYHSINPDIFVISAHYEIKKPPENSGGFDIELMNSIIQ